MIITYLYFYIIYTYHCIKGVSFGVGNQVQMALVQPDCTVVSLPGDTCDPNDNSCDDHCKTHFRSESAHGACGLKIHICVCYTC